MSMPARMVLGLYLGVLVIMMSIPSAPGLTIHPAVLKNFVGPYRKQGDPILRTTFFERPHNNGQRLVSRSGGPAVSVPAAVRQSDPYYARQLTDDDVAMNNRQESVYPAAIRGPPLPNEWNRPLRSCKGSGSCNQNMDNTLNLLMRMMETGKR